MATTTNYSWSTPDNTAYVKDGASAIRTLGSSVDTTLFTALGGTYPGLRLIKKQTIGNGVSSVAVTDAYSSTYNAYKIIITGGVASTNSDLTYINTGSSASYAYGFIYLPFGSVVSAASSTSTTSFPFAGHGSTNVLRMNLDVLNPFTATHTQFSSNTSSNTLYGTGGGFHNVATSYTGFTIAPSTGTLTGGTIYVYGYGAS